MALEGVWQDPEDNQLYFSLKDDKYFLIKHCRTFNGSLGIGPHTDFTLYLAPKELVSWQE